MSCGKNYGPSFGKSELIVQLEPFNKPNACYSYTYGVGYNIPVNWEVINQLTNKKT